VDSSSLFFNFGIYGDCITREIKLSQEKLCSQGLAFICEILDKRDKGFLNSIELTILMNSLSEKLSGNSISLLF
jgi:hypothetical protein